MSDQDNPPDDTSSRDGRGRYTRDLATVDRDAQALKLRAGGLSYTAVAEALGFADRGAAYKAVQRGLAETIEEPAAEVRQFELERLDAALVRLDGLEAEARKVLARKHITVSNGKIIRLDDEPLEDDAPVLNAIDRLVKIEEARLRNSEARRKLLGLDAPTRAEVGGTLSYEIVGVDLGQL